MFMDLKGAHGIWDPTALFRARVEGLGLRALGPWTLKSRVQGFGVYSSLSDIACRLLAGTGGMGYLGSCTQTAKHKVTLNPKPLISGKNSSNTNVHNKKKDGLHTRCFRGWLSFSTEIPLLQARLTLWCRRLLQY